MHDVVNLPGQRQAAIRERLERDGRVLAVDLAQDFGTSEDTIRRDLRDLAASGLCRRVYGGALRVSPASAPVAERRGRHLEAKRALAQAAVALIEPGQTVVLDTGSTNLCIAEALPDDLPVTIVTNAPAIATMRGINRTVIMIGGRVDPNTGGSHGARAMRDALDLQADLLFLGACAVSAETGVAVFDPEEAAFKQVLVSRSARTVVAATDEKLATRAPFSCAPIDAVSALVVGASAPARHLARLGLPPKRIIRAAAF